jgi:integrase
LRPKPEKKKRKTDPYQVTCVKNAFNSSLKRAGIEDFWFLDLRHTFNSQQIMKGGTLRDTKELLGHKAMTMTLRYAQLSKEHKKGRQPAGWIDKWE